MDSIKSVCVVSLGHTVVSLAWWQLEGRVFALVAKCSCACE